MAIGFRAYHYEGELFMYKNRLIKLLLVSILLTVLFSFSQEINPINEGAALLAYEQNTVEIAKLYGPSVVAVNASGNWRERIEDFEFDLELDDFDFEIPLPFLKENSEGNRRFSFRWQGEDDEEDLTLELPPELEDRLRERLPENFSLNVPDGVVDLVMLEDILPESQGSGFLIDDQHILTNYHVVRSALVKGELELKEYATITVRFPGSDEDLAVDVIGIHSDYDLALLQIKKPEDIPENVVFLSLGDSDSLLVGQKTIAIGNPFGLSATVTTGVVSAIDRLVPLEKKGIPMIQTDAAINLGSSGGPLLNSKGEVVGINTAVLQGRFPLLGGKSSVGFAVPSNVIAEVLPSLRGGSIISDSTDAHFKLGIRVRNLEDYPEAIRQTLRLPESGVIVIEVAKGSPAEAAGLMGTQFSTRVKDERFELGGDVILEADGEGVASVSELQEKIFAKEASDVVELKLWRNGEELVITVEAVQ